MTKKDLFDGLNYIDDQIIEEAQPTGESAGYSDEIYVKNHEIHYGGKEDKNRKKHKKICTGSKSACHSGGSPCCCSLRHGGCAA